MSHATQRGLLLLLALSSLPELARADKLDDGLRRCARVSDQAQRLACFDAIVSTLPQLQADRFGMTVEIERKRDPVAVQQAKDAVLTAKIAGLRQASNGEWAFTLDNHQVWIEAEPRPKVEFTVGEDVRIEHGAMSALWLVADQHRKVRVKRLQ